MKYTRFYSLDLLRGIAALSVFLSHFGNIQLPIFHEGLLRFQTIFLWCNRGLHWGVIVFVVLSGFSIHIHYAALDTFSIRKYCKRRLLRIYPVLIFAMVLGFVVDYFLYARSFFAYFYNFFSNVLLLSGFLPIDPPLSNPIMHTAIVEILIYISYPFLFRIFKKQKLLVLLVVLFVHLVNFSFIYYNVNPTWVGRNFFSLSLYWWIGALFAEITCNQDATTLQLKKYLHGWKPLLAGYLLYFTTSHLINIPGSHIFKSIELSIVSGILLSTLVEMESKNTYKIQFYGLQKIGLVAYSLYAIHIPIVQLNTTIFINWYNHNTLLYYSIWLSVSLLTIVTFYLIEKPFHEIARKN